ncbi:MAG: DedA family protein [Gammaproteobacteria bacterium]|nr:DedA family protein [Gammaproteobacteria bacterium]
MGGITEIIQGYLDQYGYPVLFFVVFVESFGVPAPGQTLLIAAALLAATGNLDLWIVLVITFVAAVSGDCIGWLLGHRGGRRLILRYGGWVGLNRHRFRRLRTHFNRHGEWFVTFARFIDFLRQINGLLAGSVRMPFLRFLIFNALGAALWVCIWGFAAYYVGQALEHWLDTFELIITWLFIAVMAGGLLFLLFRFARWLWGRYKRRGTPEHESP